MVAPQLAPIPFGAALAMGFDSEAACCEFMARFPDAPSRFGAIGPAEKFRMRLRNVALPDVSLVAGAGTAKATTHTDALHLRVPRSIPLKALGTSWLPAIQALCSTVDALGCDGARLAAAGLDDVILRTVVTMLRPEWTMDAARNGHARTFDLDPLLEWTTAHLAGRLTLADMERWSGLSARTIQLAFQRRFGLGPMQWVRERRLDLLRARLLVAPRDAKVAALAEACGLTRPATVAEAYARRFGELPSETLRRSGR